MNSREVETCAGVLSQTIDASVVAPKKARVSGRSLARLVLSRAARFFVTVTTGRESPAALVKSRSCESSSAASSPRASSWSDFVPHATSWVATATATATVRPSFADLFKHRNVPLAMLTLMCAMGGIFVMGAMMPNYLTDYLHLSIQQMGGVASAIGFGGALGQFAMPTVSDFIGRKLATLISYILAAVFTYLFAHTGADNLTVLFWLLFFAALFNFSALAILAGPVAAEAAPIGMVASVAGLVIGAGEIFGGGVAPSVAGRIAATSGIQHVFTFTIGTTWGVLRYEPQHYQSVQAFLLLFFLYYVGIAVAYAHRQAPQLKSYVDGTLVFGTPMLAASLQFPLVKDFELGMAYSALALGLFYGALATVLAKRRAIVGMLVDAFVALAVVFGTLAIPMALDGRWLGKWNIGRMPDGGLAFTAQGELARQVANGMIDVLDRESGQWKRRGESATRGVLLGASGEQLVFSRNLGTVELSYAPLP